jgi:hypothetical protein
VKYLRSLVPLAGGIIEPEDLISHLSDGAIHLSRLCVCIGAPSNGWFIWDIRLNIVPGNFISYKYIYLENLP